MAGAKRLILGRPAIGAVKATRQSMSLWIIPQEAMRYLADPSTVPGNPFSYRANPDGPEQDVIRKTLVALGRAGADPAIVDTARARRAGALFRLADRLVEEGVLDGPLDDMETQHRLQKCAYIAQRLGADIGYEFGFLGSGAFSDGLAVDIYHRWAARGGAWPFEGMPREEAGFFRLVRGHSRGWLQTATLALEPRETPLTREGFAEHVARGNSRLDRRLAASVFDEVRAVLGSIAAGDGA